MKFTFQHQIYRGAKLGLNIVTPLATIDQDTKVRKAKKALL